MLLQVASGMLCPVLMELLFLLTKGTEQACVDENYGGITGRTCIILQTSYVMSRTDTDASLSAVLHMC